MVIPRFLAHQLGNPSGLFGRLCMGRLLNRLNADHHGLVLRCLAPSRSDRILDVGFGGGSLLAHLAQVTPDGFIAGIEISAEMIENAKRRLHAQIEAGLVDIKFGSVGEIPFPDASFDMACSVNTIYFWHDLSDGLRELARVLRPKGRLVLGYRAAEDMRGAGLEDRGFRLYRTADIELALSATGFESESLDRIGSGRTTAYALTAARST